MRRMLLACVSVGVVVAGVMAGIGHTVAAAPAMEPYCSSHAGACPDTRTHLDYEGNYVGHDEPAVNFYSNRPGSGNSNTWQLQLPSESQLLPKQDGSGGTWNFQQRITFWFGMALCETQSYPN